MRVCRRSLQDAKNRENYTDNQKGSDSISSLHCVFLMVCFLSPLRNRRSLWQRTVVLSYLIVIAELLPPHASSLRIRIELVVPETNDMQPDRQYTNLIGVS